VHEFRVWAPRAQRVEVVLGDQALPLDARSGGWWSRSVEAAGPGTRYAYRLDGGPPRPDPRSACQPEGVHGPSEVVDHAAFAWTDGAWRGLPLAGSVLYELHIGTFTPAGTFDAAIDRLDHLVALGVDAVELLPVVEFPGSRGWGYDGVDLYAPHHVYGGPDGLKRLVDACHARGLGVVLDVVYNHLGPAGNYLPEFGPYFSDRLVTNWGDAVNFDGPGSDEVRAFVIDNARTWLRDYHIDGLRLDAVHAIVDDSATHVLEELAADVEALAAEVGRPLFLIAESDLNAPRFVRSRDAGGYGLDSAWADEWHHALHAALTGERDGYYEDYGSLDLLAKALRQAWVYDGGYSVQRRRRHGRPPTGLAGRRFVVCTQNHDQVGNRAAGDRLGALVSEGRLRVAAGLLLTSPFVPLLFQGEEWGAGTPFQYFTDHDDPELGRAVSEGRRSEFRAFGWEPADVPDPQDPATFARSRLDWSEPERAPHAGLLAWYRELLALRRRLPALRDDRPGATSTATDAGTITVRRGPVLVVAHLGPDERRVAVAGHRLVAVSDDRVTLVGEHVILAPDTLAVLEARVRE
jgi:maltooligosyltrehalose trehalohydrolase